MTEKTTPIQPQDETGMYLRLPGELLEKIVQRAHREGFPTSEAFIEYRLTLMMKEKIGAAHIDAPGVMSGATTQKITGFKGGIVSRG